MPTWSPSAAKAASLYLASWIENGPWLWAGSRRRSAFSGLGRGRLIAIPAAIVFLPTRTARLRRSILSVGPGSGRPAAAGAGPQQGRVEHWGGSLPVQPGWPAALPDGRGPGRDDEPRGRGGLAVEVPGIQDRAPDDLVDPAELSDGELGRAECGGQRGVLELGAGAFHAVREDRRMVEGQPRRALGDVLHGLPPGGCRICASHRLRQAGGEREVGDSDDAQPGVTARVAVAGQLLEVNHPGAQAGFLS